MNRLKLTIKNDTGNTIFKMGSSVESKQEYSDLEIADILQDLSDMIRREQKRETSKIITSRIHSLYSTSSI